jgi:uncharacterized membrane protein
MSELVVFSYEHPDRAGEVLQEIATLKRENVRKPLIGIEDAAVVVKREDGKLKIRQTLESAMKGTQVVTGGLWGVLIGFLLGGPLLGALAGLGLGAILGRRLDIGIDNDFIERLGNELSSGDSALFLLVKETPVETLVEELNTRGGRLFHTSLSDEAAAAFTQAAHDEQVARALEEEQRS